MIVVAAGDQIKETAAVEICGERVPSKVQTRARSVGMIVIHPIGKPARDADYIRPIDPASAGGCARCFRVGGIWSRSDSLPRGQGGVGGGAITGTHRNF